MLPFKDISILFLGAVYECIACRRPCRVERRQDTRWTPTHINPEIDRQTDGNTQRYAGASREAILKRIEELDKEWDMERCWKQCCVIRVTGLALGLTTDKRCFTLTGAVRVSCCSMRCKAGARYRYCGASAWGRTAKIDRENMHCKPCWTNVQMQGRAVPRG